MEKIYKLTTKLLEALLILLFVLLVIDVFWQVFARYSIGKPNAFTEELARYLLIWLAILGTAYVRSYSGELAIDYFYNKLSPKRQRVLSLWIEALVLLFALVVMIIGGSNLMYITLKLGQMSPTLHISIGYIYSVVPLSGLLIVFYSAYHISQILKSSALAEGE